MPRKITSATSLDQLKRDAKRWLRDIEANDRDAVARFRKALPDATDTPRLRDVQLAIAREFGVPGWAALKSAIEASNQPAEDFGKLVDRFLDNACPDHHVRGVSDHIRAEHTAMRLLRRFPRIADAGFHTAIVCGDLQKVERMLRDDPGLASRRASPENKPREGSGGEHDLYRDFGPKGWEPLNYLCFTRLPLPAVAQNAVSIARLLLDHGANPNTYFMAGGSRYTPLVGAIGCGEESRPSHQKRNELVQLLLERGANPFDIQVIYNLNFDGDNLWYLQTIHDHTRNTPLAKEWQDPDWSMMNMGAYGTGARWFLEYAITRKDHALLEWCLSHGANPNATPKRDERFPRLSLYAVARQRGLDNMAELLARHGAEVVELEQTPQDEFTAACMRLDRDFVARAIREDPALLTSTDAIFAAANENRADVVAMLLDMGFSPNVANEQNERALHMAAYSNAVDVARLLVERGAEIDPVEKNWGNTPLGAAVYGQQKAMIAFLAPYTKDVWELVYGGHINRLRELLTIEPQRARVETSNGHTPLMWLPTFDEDLAMEVAVLLLERGADPAKRNAQGETAADRARALGMYEVADTITSFVSAR